MNRLGLLKRALGLAATPALLTLPPEWKAATPVGVPEPARPMFDGFTSGYVSVGGYHRHPIAPGDWAMHTHNPGPHIHTAAPTHSHTVFPMVTIDRDQARALGILLP